MSKLIGVVCGMLSFNALDRNLTRSFLTEEQHLFDLRMACVEFVRSPHFKVGLAMQMQQQFNQFTHQFIAQHREFLSAHHPERMAQYEDGLITAQELLDTVWEAHPNARAEDN